MSRALDQAVQLAEASRDPVVAMKNNERLVALLRRAQGESPGSGGQNSAVLEQLERTIARRLGRLEPLAQLGVTKIVRLDQVTPLAPGQKTPPLQIEWPGGAGWARSIYATTLDGDPTSLVRVAVRISINGSDDLFTTGTASTFVPLAVFSPGVHTWFRLAGPNGEEDGYPVSALTKWTVQFEYEGPQGPGPTITPVLLFGYARERA